MRILDELEIAGRLLVVMRSQWWSAERIRAAQGRALVHMLQHAAANVPFYRRLNLRPETITSTADLQRFPVIGKSDVQRRPESFIAGGFSPDALHGSRTSGSSGQPTTTFFDHRAWLLTKYVLKMRRIAATAGVPLLRRVMIASEQGPELLDVTANAGLSRFSLFFRQHHLSIHTPIEKHLPELASYQPHIFYAFPSYFLDLILAAERLGISLPRIETLYTSSEVLTPAARSRIEAAFAGRVYDVYGSTEFKEVAWQCRNGRYHVNFESVYVEMREPGSCGSIILSSLCNFAMPLLRFDIGDRGVFGSNHCPCGRASPHMIAFDGREGDMITLPSQRRLSPYLLTTTIESEESILQYRIVQTNADAFRVDVIVRFPGQSVIWRDRVCSEFQRVAGERVVVTVREVDRLERAPGGKRSAFMRELAGLA